MTFKASVIVYVACILLATIYVEADESSNTSYNVAQLLQGYSSGKTCCARLSSALNSSVSYEDDPVYRQEQNGTGVYGYWSSIEIEQHPFCRVTPWNTQEVSNAVKILSLSNCQFAIRSGGHTPWANASNIDGGVTIDLSVLNNITVSPDQTHASIGPGARWADVYSTLSRHGLAVSGGRVSSVGVGGLALGGGKSFFASLYGFVADNVENFEVVTATGAILNANPNKHPDLYRALKGGSSNFGVVTRFDVRTFKQGDLWAGQVVYPVSTMPQQLRALADFTDQQGNHPNATADAQVIWAFVTTNTYQIVANFYSFTEPTPWPPAFDAFKAINESVVSTLRVGGLTQFSQELNQGTPNGFRYLFATATFGNDGGLYQELVTLANATFIPFVAQGTKGITFSFVLQPLTKPMLKHGCGKNVLGLCPNDGNLMILDLTMQWGDATDDVEIDEAARKLIAGAMARAKNRGVYNEYQYLNYAASWQQPIASYGEENVEFLKRTAKEYDPGRVFQRLVGGYKLPK